MEHQTVTVAQLIAALSDCYPDAEVRIALDGYLPRSLNIRGVHTTDLEYDKDGEPTKQAVWLIHGPEMGLFVPPSHAFHVDYQHDEKPDLALVLSSIQRNAHQRWAYLSAALERPSGEPHKDL